MKKQLLIAAVAATMATASMADISISGGATANINSVSGSDTTYASDIDLKIVGKAGDTSATVDLEFVTTAEPAASNFVKNAYISTKIAGANVKIGDWYGSDSLLGNGSNNDVEQISVDYTMGDIKVQWEDSAGSDSVTVSGTVGGVAISHEMFSTKTDTKISGTAAGVSLTYRVINEDAADTDAMSFEASTTISGIKLAYAKVEHDAATTGTSDAFFGAQTALGDATGVSVGTSIAGNNVTFKAMDMDGVDTNKLIINRPMAGGTFEATFADPDNGNSSVDLELAVKF